MRNNYHHGDLKRQLIQTGLELLNEKGIDGLSLRKAAEKCGVSHGAPYSHFKNKNDFLKAMNDFVEEEFSKTLLNAIADGEEETVMLRLAKTYVHFFCQNPAYYSFYAKYADFKIEIDEKSIFSEHSNSFLIFQSTAQRYLQTKGIPEEKHATQIIKMWAMVQGLTMLASVPHVNCYLDWTDFIEKMLTEKEDCK